MAKAKTDGPSLRSPPARGRGGRKLKVYRTAIGFHDAYVAARSQKAALEAWGTDSNLFARGAAEVVDDPELSKAPLERPGEVIKVLRGSEAEQIRALGPTRRSGTSTGSRKAPAKGRGRGGGEVEDWPSPRPSPAGGRGGKGRRPSRARLDRAERALAAFEERQRAAIAKLAAEARAIEDKRRKLEARQRAEKARLEERLAEEREAHARAIALWAGA